MAEIGDIYKVIIYYRGTSGRGKSRPVLILNIQGNFYTIVEITGTPPKNPPKYYDLAKEEIHDWQNYNLDRLSWIKCANRHVIENPRLYQKIGSMKDTDEFERIVDKVNEYI